MTPIETRLHDDATMDVKIGRDTVKAVDKAHAQTIETAARLAYRAGRADEAAVRATVLNGLLSANPTG